MGIRLVRRAEEFNAVRASGVIKPQTASAGAIGMPFMLFPS